MDRPNATEAAIQDAAAAPNVDSVPDLPDVPALLLAGEKRLLEMIARAEPLEGILEACCRLFDEVAQDAVSSVLLMDEGGTLLRPGSAPNLPPDFMVALEGSALIGPGEGSCGTAAWRREPVFVSDIATDALWDKYRRLPLGVARYVTTTGDQTVLDEVVHFLEGRPVKPEEDSYYDMPTRSAVTGSVYEHCVRAIRNGLRFGVHGLPLIGSCDWNDGMDKVGEEGKGESVWLAFFLYEVLQRFAEVADQRGDAGFAAECREEARWRTLVRLDRDGEESPFRIQRDEQVGRHAGEAGHRRQPTSSVAVAFCRYKGHTGSAASRSPTISGAGKRCATAARSSIPAAAGAPGADSKNASSDHGNGVSTQRRLGHGAGR
eukprot:gene27804-31406_t